MAILLVDCGGKPQDFRCAPLAPNYIFMISSCRMNVAEKKWLKGHLLYYILRQANDALHWFHVWSYVSTPCSHRFVLPYSANRMLDMGSTIGGVAQNLRMPIGNMVLHISHAACFRKTCGPTLVAMLHLMPSNGKSHLESLRFLGRHPMGVGFDGMAWVSF